MHSVLRAGVDQAAATTAGTPLPGLEAAAGLLNAVIVLCERVPHNKHVFLITSSPPALLIGFPACFYTNRHAARRLADRGKEMYEVLEQYQGVDLPDRVIKYRDEVFELVSLVLFA